MSPFTLLDSTEEAPMRDAMIDTLWPQRDSGVLLGPDKAGKSTYALEEALCLATGWPVLGRFNVSVPRRILYVTEEDLSERMRRRIYDLIRLHPESGVGDDAGARAYFRLLQDQRTFAVVVKQNVRLHDAGSVAKLEQAVKEYGTEVLYLDALGEMTQQRISHDHDAGQVVDVFRRLEAAGPVLRVIHHTSKAKRHGWTPDTATVRDASGHHAIADWCRASLLFSRRAPVTVQPKPALVVEVPSLIRFEGSDGAPVKVGSMVQRHQEYYDPRNLTKLVDGHLAALTLAEAEAKAGSKLDAATLSKVIAALADPRTPRVTDPRTQLVGVPAVVVADRAGFKTNAPGKMKAVRYLTAAVAAGKATRVTAGRENQTVRGTALWEAA